MPNFTVTLRLDQEPFESSLIECVDIAVAVETAREILQARIKSEFNRRRKPSNASIGVGCGSFLEHSGPLPFIGEWEWNIDDGWYWQEST